MRKGFTLIELLVVVGIVLILASFAVPSYLLYRTRTLKSKASHDIKALSKYIEAYHQDWNTYPVTADLAGITAAGDAVNVSGANLGTGEDAPINYSGTQDAAVLAIKYDDPFAAAPNTLYTYEVNASGTMYRLYSAPFRENGVLKVVYYYSTGESGVGTAPATPDFAAVP